MDYHYRKQKGRIPKWATWFLAIEGVLLGSVLGIRSDLPALISEKTVILGMV